MGFAGCFFVDVEVVRVTQSEDHVHELQLTSREMRRLVLLHGVLSFAFNTVILALTINTVSGLL